MPVGTTLIQSLQHQTEGLADFANTIRGQGINLDNPLVKLKFKRTSELLPLELETERAQAGLASIRSLIAQRKDIRDEDRFKLDEKIKEIGITLKVAEESRRVKKEKRDVTRAKELSSKTVADIKRTQALTDETTARITTREEQSELIDFISKDTNLPISIVREMITKRLGTVLATTDTFEDKSEIVSKLEESILKFNKQKNSIVIPDTTKQLTPEETFLKKFGLK